MSSDMFAKIAAMNPVAAWWLLAMMRYTHHPEAPEAANEPSFGNCNALSFEGWQHPHAA